MYQTQEYNDFNEILRLLEFSLEIQESIRNYYVKNSKWISKQSELAYEGEAPNFPLCKRKPFTRLIVVIYKLIEVSKKYKNLSIPDTIFKNTISDVSLRAKLYENKTNEIGLDIDSVVWFRHIFNIVIFKIGTIQFQLFHMIYLDEEFLGEPYMTFPEKWKKQLPSGAPVINVHIQKGADLTPEAVSNSFIIAGEFFRKYFPKHDYKAFICYSWFLYPGLREFLQMDSRIMQFADRFTIIGSVQDNEDAIRRIYGHRYRAKIDYPKETSLQQKALYKMNLLGRSCGIILR
ncbi:hypothetical protein [Clostridium sp. KNHs205]|jgi:hypothetical protein|uniref:hypothetical protein n=1 Tax=Clostridium sp. KNHs205 TaxID=1449050 RepID=UPI00051C9D37|nr:hypothetical protein [Clostridium sp. KNHs205]